MEFKLVESTKDKLVMEFEQFDQGILNLVKHELWNDEATELAGFKITHPEIGHAKFVLRTKGKSPKTVWNLALKRATEQAEQFAKAIK